MEPMLLGFKESSTDDVVEDKSHSFKLVPWISWDEWKFVKEALFSSSPDSVASALQRISTWRSRGCIPVVIEVTASIIEIQQKDPFFRNDLNESAWQSEEMLAMLYCMAIMRLVNGVVEKTRKKNEVSIGEAAEAFGIPRILIDIRHEGSHRDLPSLRLVRLASEKALDWLISYYWEPQEKAIPIQNGQTENLRKEIKRRLQEVALCLKAKQIAKSSGSRVKGKRVRQAHNEFLFRVAGKQSHSNSTSSKKQLTKSLKNVLWLYSSFSPEVVHVLLEFLLNALDSSNLAEHSKDSLMGCRAENEQTAYDDWKAVALKLSNKEPEFLLTLTHAVLEKWETQEAMNCELGEHRPLENSFKSYQIDLFSCLFEWLVRNLKKLNLMSHKEPAESKGSLTEKHLPKATLLGLLCRCLSVSFPGNKQLIITALALAHLIGDNSVLHKLKKLSLLGLSNSEPNSVDSYSEILHCQQEDSIHSAEEKFELIRRSQIKGKIVKPKDSDTGVSRRWNVAKSWNSCPIGMLPQTTGFSGLLPILDCNDEYKEAVKLSDSKEHHEHNQNGKREDECGIQELDNTSVKKVKETETECESYKTCDISSEGVKGHLMIDGVWKKVGEKELLAIASAHAGLEMGFFMGLGPDLLPANKFENEFFDFCKAWSL